jgi:hypothetical protein
MVFKIQEYSVVLLQFFNFLKIILLNAWRSVSFCQCWFPPTVPLRWCLPRLEYAHITLESVALDAPNNMTAFVTDVQLNEYPQSIKIGQASHSPIFHTDSHTSTIECKQMAQHSVLPTVTFFQYNYHKSVSFLISLVFPLFCPSRLNNLFQQIKIFCKTVGYLKMLSSVLRPPLWSSGQSSWL